MASLQIREYTRAAIDGRGMGIAAGEEPGKDQPALAIGGASAPSAQLGLGTRFIRLHAEAICCIAVADANGAAVTGAGRMVAGQTEFFGIAPNGTYFVHVISSI